MAHERIFKEWASAVEAIESAPGAPDMVDVCRAIAMGHLMVDALRASALRQRRCRCAANLQVEAKPAGGAGAARARRPMEQVFGKRRTADPLACAHGVYHRMDCPDCEAGR